MLRLVQHGYLILQLLDCLDVLLPVLVHLHAVFVNQFDLLLLFQLEILAQRCDRRLFVNNLIL